MKQIEFLGSFITRKGVSVLGSLVFVIAIAMLAAAVTPAQVRNVNEAQSEIRQRMIREQGGNNPSVQFNDGGRFETVSNSETRVRGSGTYFRNRNESGRRFNYTAVFRVRDGDLRSLTYNFTGSGPWNPGDGGGWNGGATTTPPSWAQGTFYSTRGQNITLTINRNGRVTAVNQGQTFYGRYNRGSIYLNNDTSTVTRRGNGIRTYNRDTNQTTDYARDFQGGGVGDGPSSTPPSWAQGTFYATSGGQNISLTINRNGRVTVVNSGQTFYGSYYNGSITVNNDTSTVTRRNNGIRTYNRNTGQTTNYRKQ